jgi:RNA polymerase sigma-70 factor (sigma-E family)
MRGGGTSSSHDDGLLSRLYRQATAAQEPHFAAGYDLEAGLDRYQAWLRKHTDGADATGAPAADAAIDSAADTVIIPAADTVIIPAVDAAINGAAESDAFLSAPTARTEWNAELAVIEMYSMHYSSLVRLAAMLVRDTQTAEEVVQDAFIAMHDGWDRLRDAEKALAYMRQAVVNRSRSVLRHRLVVEKNQQKPPPDMPSAEHGALTLLERSAVIAALRELPERQREAIVLRYYADLSEAEIAAAMKISRGAVKSHTSRGMAALRAALEDA